jgi:hypothetical protein
MPQPDEKPRPEKPPRIEPETPPAREADHPLDDDERVDIEGEDSFPASDPPSSNRSAANRGRPTPTEKN